MSVAPQGAPAQKTFQEKTQKPATDTELKPIPQTDTHFNSMPAPALPDPRDRTTARPVYTSARVALTAATVPALPVQDDGWRAAKD
jgi:hypothetical protein